MNPASTPAPAGLVTESASAASAELDLFPTEGLIDAFVDDQLNAVKAVRTARADLVRAVQAAVPRIAAGGRLIYVGAGTSGRLGLLDSVELYPTFSWPKQRAIALLAGGSHAVLEAVEGAEDDFEQGAQDLRAVSPSANDVVLLLAASGRTPYALGALQAARGCGALTIAIANNPRAELTREAEIGITLDTGPEVIAGSTRLKAGTSQKIALNSFSSALMVGLNKVYGNLMVDLRPTNAKLYRRAVNVTIAATGASEDAARATLESCGYRIKVAIVALKRGEGVATAEARLAAVDGNVRRALADPETGPGPASADTSPTCPQTLEP
jgi:N-acetylmuramic acid 6-phosphate etherase